MRDLKRENREKRKKREGHREGKEIKGHRRESVHGSELRHSRKCVREKMRRGDGGVWRATSARTYMKR